MSFHSFYSMFLLVSQRNYYFLTFTLADRMLVLAATNIDSRQSVSLLPSLAVSV